MKQLNDHCTYELTEQEDLQSHILNGEQLAKFKNIRMDLIIQKGNITVDLSHPNSSKFIQDQAWLQGQLDLINVLINAHEEALIALANQQKEIS